MKISKTSQILTTLFSLACTIAAGYLILRGSGMFPEPSISLILLTAIFIILLSSSRKSFLFNFIPLSLLTRNLYADRLKFWCAKLPIYCIGSRDGYVRDQRVSHANPCE